MRKEFEMTPEEMTTILKACEPVLYMVVGGREPSSPQENANCAWKALANKRGFIWDTVRPNGKGNRFFTAEVKE